MVIAPCPGMKHNIDATRTPWIIAHRGGRLDAPENTRAAFEAALDHPIDGLELDIQMTKDGVAVLHHDGNLQKINGDRRRISDFDYEELTGLDWGGWYAGAFAGERIVTLEELLRLYAGRTRLLVEIKSFLRDRRKGRSFDLTREVLSVVHQQIPPPRDQRIFILSFDLDVLDYAHQMDPGWKYVWNLPGSVPAVSSLRIPDYLHALCLPVHRLSTAFVNDLHRRGKRVMTYSCNSPRQVDKAWAANADVIMTDRPGWICDYIALRGSGHDS